VSAPYFWSNVAISIETALGSALALSGITKADPGVASFAADPSLSDGDFISLSVAGMTQVDGRVFRVEGAAGSGPYTLELGGEDTTNYATFANGNAYAITFGNTLNKTTAVQVTGGDAQYEEWTYIQDTVRRRQATSFNPIQLSFECVWDPADTTLAALLADSKLFTNRAIKIAFASGTYPVMVFRGGIGATLLPTGQAQGLVKTSLTIDGQGFPTYYTAAP